eukprot:822448_1
MMISKEYPITPSLETVPSLQLVQSETTELEIVTANIIETSPIKTKLVSDYYFYSSSDFDEILDDDSNVTDDYFDNDKPYTTHSLFTMNDNNIFEDNGYHKICTISKTLQGTLFKACKINDPYSFVTIKKTDKLLFRQR